jgi:alginate O-acetyltransferase complex protein AlgJ
MKTIPTLLLPLLALALVAPTLASADDDPGAALRAACATKATQTPVVSGGDGWLFLPAELRHISVGKFWGDDAAKVSKASKPENADPLPAILDFKKQLDSAGIDLIMVPVPCKAFVYPEAILGGSTTGPAPARMDTFHQQFFDQLKQNGITVIDLLPDFLAARNGPDGPLYCKQDTHWSGNGIAIASQKITALLSGKPWLTAAPKVQTSTKDGNLEITGDLYGMLPTTIQMPKETVKLRFVGTADSAGATPIPVDKTSPVVLLGDSHTLVFHEGGDMLAVGAGLADQLAHDLGTTIDLIGVRGSGATPARVNLMRRAHGDPNYLAGKKVVIWCFSEREFTEGNGWAKVPVVAAKP